MRLGLRATVVLSLMGILVAMSLLFSVVVLRIMERVLVDEATNGARATASVVSAAIRGVGAASTAHPHWLDLDVIQERVERFSNLPDVSEIVVVAPDLHVLAHSDRSAIGERLLDPLVAPTLLEATSRWELVGSSAQPRVFRAYSPVVLQGQPVAVVRITLTLQPLEQLLSTAQAMVLVFMGLDALLLFLVGSYLLDRLIVRPLRDLTQATERVRIGVLDPIHFISSSGNEIGRLSTSFNRMVDALAEHRASLRQKIEELERTNRELSRARETMIRAERLASVGTLAAGVAHEVGNPLTAILGFTNLLLQDQDMDPELVREAVERIHDQTLRIHRIIRDLLDYSRSKPRDATAGCRVHEVVRSAVGLLEPQPRMRGVSTRVEVPDDLPEVSIQAHELEQVLVNLLLNAADAAGGGGTIEISAALRDDGAAVVLSVTDDGHGMDEATVSRVFDPFFTTKEPGKGTGLGLAICERIVTDARGEIHVQSAPGEGTTVTLTLPVRHGDEGPVVSEPGASEGGHER